MAGMLEVIGLKICIRKIILLIVIQVILTFQQKKSKFKEHATLRVESKIEKRLEQTGLRKAEVFSLEPWISITCESISEVNDKLEKGRYFYTDIKNEGILLYDSGEQLARAKNLLWSEVKEMAKEDYEYWCGRGKSFFIDCKYPLERGDFSKSAFELHQATRKYLQ